MMIPWRRIRVLALTVALAGVGSSQSAAQRVPGPGRGGDRDRARLEQRVRARFAETVQRRLGLSDEESKALGEVVEGLQAERRALGRDERALRQDLNRILDAEGTTDDQAREVLGRMDELRLREARLFQSEQEKLLEVLTPVQLIRFHAMREQLAARIQQLRGGPPGPGRRPGGGVDPENLMPGWPQ